MSLAGLGSLFFPQSSSRFLLDLLGGSLEWFIAHRKFPDVRKVSSLRSVSIRVRGSGWPKGSWALALPLGRLPPISGPQFPSLQSHLLVGVEVSVSFVLGARRTAGAAKALG